MTNEQRAIIAAQEIVLKMRNDKLTTYEKSLDCRLTQAARDYIYAIGYDVEQLGIDTTSGTAIRLYQITFKG
jgi:hypothetical protein